MKRIKIQKGRTDKFFAFEWEQDQLGGLMIASVTIFGWSFVWLGTAA
jgi:hypothetical protein